MTEITKHSSYLCENPLPDDKSKTPLVAQIFALSETFLGLGPGI